MATRRILREMRVWDALPAGVSSDDKLASFWKEFTDEHKHWTLRPSGDTGLVFDAELCPASGPFRGLSWSMILSFPTDYPFQPPKLAPGTAPTPSGSFFHPLLHPNGSLCTCGITQEWSPKHPFALVLAFYRVAAETLKHDSQQCVPSSGERLMCFCSINEAARNMAMQDQALFCSAARIAAFGERALPLIVSEVAEDESGDTLRITFTNMAGNVVSTFEHFRADVRVGHLYHRIFEELSTPDPSFRWALVLPSGEVADQSILEQPLRHALGLLREVTP